MKYLKSFYLLENTSQAKSLLSKLGISKDNDNFIKIKNMLNGNGYVYWFTKLFFVGNVSFEELQNVWNIIKSEPQIISKFSEPIVKLENLEKFWDEYLLAKGQNNAKNIYNQFPSAQKRMVYLKDEGDILLLNDLFRDKDKDNFIKKISRYHSRKNLIDSLKLFLYNKSENKFNVLLKSLQDSNVVIRYASDENDIIVCVVNYQQLRKFGSDTSWCIVGSEGTFKSYNSHPLSQQFIVFLLDKTDNYSKIGITTDTSGINTTHLKNDSHIEGEKIKEILRVRGFDNRLLYPTKENVAQLSWSNISVEALVSIGFTNEEILKKKNLYGSYGYNIPKKTDLEFFSKEEIEKWKLLEKTELRVSDLKSYSKEEIIKKKLLDRVVSIELYQLGEIGFSFPEIRKISKSDTFKNDPHLNFVTGKTRNQIIKLILSSSVIGNYQSKDLDREKLIKMINLQPNDIPFSSLHKTFSRSYFGSVVSEVQFFSKIYELSKEDFYLILKSRDTYGMKYLTNLCMIMSMDIFTNYCFDLITKNLEAKDTRFTFNFKEMRVIKDYLANYPDVYQQIHDKLKLKLLSDESWRRADRLGISGSENKTNVPETIENLNFWGANDFITIEDIGRIFSGIGLSSDADRVLDYCKEMGYNIEYKLIDVLKKYRDSFLETIEFCIKNSIDVDDCYDKLLDYMSQQKKKVGEYESKRINELLKKRKGYEEKWEEFQNLEATNEAIQFTKECSDYTWSRSRGNVTVEQWYEKYWPIIKKLDFSKSKKDRGEWNNVLLVCTLVLLASSNKMEEASEINADFEFHKNTSSTFSGDNVLVDLCKLVSDKHITNWKRTWRKLEYDQRKSLFEFLQKKVDEYRTQVGENLSNIYRQMMIPWYIFDRHKLDRYLEVVKKMKDNYVYTGRGDIDRTKTIRLKEVEKLLNYLAEEGKFEDIEKILSGFKLGKIEKRNSKDIGFRSNLFYARKEGDDVYGRDATKEHKEKYHQILKKYLSDPIKESFILGWYDFNI